MPDDYAEYFQRLFADAAKSPEYWEEMAIMSITEELCRVMEEKGISRTEFAKRIGRTEKYVGRIMRGSVRFDIPSIVHWSLALGCSPAIFLRPLSTIPRD